MTGPRYVLVLTGPDGRRFGIRHDGTPIHGDPQHTRGPVVDDVDAGAEIGDAGPTCTPILLDIAGEQHVLFAGSADFAQQAFTAVNGHQYPIRDGVWMSFPEPFNPGMVVTITGLDGDGKELFSIPPAALEVDKLAPLFGPGWTGFAPAE